MCPGEDGVCGWAGSVALPGLSVSALLPFSSLTTPVIPGLDLPPSAVLFLDIKLGEAETVH